MVKKAGQMRCDNTPVEVDTPSIKQTAEDVPILKENPQSSPKSLSSDLMELSQLKREQMKINTRFKVMQCDIEEQKPNLLEKESIIKMETLKVKAEHKCLNLDTARMQLKAELLHQRLQLLKEVVL